jgi:hypothetical protein
MSKSEFLMLVHPPLSPALRTNQDTHRAKRAAGRGNICVAYYDAPAPVAASVEEVGRVARGFLHAIGGDGEGTKVAGAAIIGSIVVVHGCAWCRRKKAARGVHAVARSAGICA